MSILAIGAMLACSPTGGGSADAKSSLDPEVVIDHGTLAFGTANRAELTDKNQVHGWRFSLEAPSAVTIAAASYGEAPPVVAWLYREPVTDLYAGILARTYSESPTSTKTQPIEGELQAGDYLVVGIGVTNDLGAFGLLATCAGEGCPTETCDPNAPFVAPEAQPFTTDTRDALFALFTAEPLSAGALEVLYDERCLQSGQVATAVGLAVEHWARSSGAQDAAAFAGSGPLSVEVRETTSGTRVTVSLDDTLDAYFDHQGALIATVASGDAQGAAWYYRSTGGSSIEAPAAPCVTHAEAAFAHETRDAPVLASGGSALPPVVRALVDDFAAENASSATAVGVVFETWSGQDGAGARATLSGWGSEVVRYASETWLEAEGYDLVATESEGALDFACRWLGP